MAAEDYVVADRNADFPVTARKKVHEPDFDNPDVESFAAAEAADVRYPWFIDYAEALHNLEQREDIESLASRRIRDNASDFADADYMRKPASDTAPTPGSINGVAPADV